jgi:hypothetical protein
MTTEFQLKVYAYYYPWYFGRFDHKWQTVREYSPYLGFYDSSNPAVVRQHVEWAIESGLNGFLVEWFDNDTEFGMKVDSNLAVLRDILIDYPGFEFCIFYDQKIRFGKRKFADPKKRQTFLLDLLYAGGTNFNHPNYMRIDNKPVVVFYLTRSSSDNYAGLLGEARDKLESEVGAGRPYFAGDEIWWSEKTQYFGALDAVTAYNMHNDKQLKLVAGDVRDYAVHCAGFYASMLETANARGTHLIPGIGHAYNDYFVNVNLPFIPTVVPDGPPDYRGDMIECMKAMKVVWKETPRFRDTGEAYLFITSFNEWAERSIIEPTAEIETFNTIWDYRKGKFLYIPPPRFEYLEGIREGKRLIEKNVLPSL